MESVKSEVIVYRTTVDTVMYGINQFSITLDGIYTTFWIRDKPNLAPGDHVRITITKEPTPDVLPR